MNYTAYTDGSFRSIPEFGDVYGSAYILAQEGSNDWITGYKGCMDEYSMHCNVSGEVFACMMVCEKAISQGDCEVLTIYYDYEGLLFWLNGTWKKRKTKLSQNYYLYMTTQVLPKIKINFVWVKGHNGVAGNGLVDRLAKLAIDEYVLRNS